jgi:triosephosphate isomerase
MIASGVSTADDCYNVVKLGADGTGATSGILNAPSPAVRVQEMAEAIVKAYKEREGK